MAGERATTLDSREFCMAGPRRAPRRSALARRPANDPATAGAPEATGWSFAEYRKAMVGGIGAITAAAVPLVSFLPAGVGHWLAAAAAVLTGFATYLIKNDAPASADRPSKPPVPSPPQETQAQLPANPPSAAHTGPVLAGLALIVGGAVWAGRHSERHSRCITLLAPGGFSVGR